VEGGGNMYRSVAAAATLSLPLTVDGGSHLLGLISGLREDKNHMSCVR
jgi:hypothetical protein